MVKFALQFKATLENLTRLRPLGEDFRWFLKLKCGNCGEVSDKWQYITLMDSVPLKGGRGSASMVQKCKLCSRENSIGFFRQVGTLADSSRFQSFDQTAALHQSRNRDILGASMQPYNAEDSETFKTIVEFECRGLEPVDFQPQAGFAGEGADTGTPFNDINLQEKDWTDYDEKAQESVGVYEVAHQFKKC